MWTGLEWNCHKDTTLFPFAAYGYLWICRSTHRCFKLVLFNAQHMHGWSVHVPTLISSLCFSTVLEFIYAQSPEYMKGLLTGLVFFLLIGISPMLSSVVFTVYPKSTKNNELILYHTVFTIIQVIHLAIGAAYFLPCIAIEYSLNNINI